VLLLIATACGGTGAADLPTLVIGGIPDEDVEVLEERFGGVAAHLESVLEVPVEYRPSTDYAAVVTGFTNGDVPLAWFGGLTGVQARLAVPGAEAVAQRPIDAEFESVFVTGPGVEAESLADLAGLRFTFGSESSTSGHLMPRFFLREAGIDAAADFDGDPGFSGSHDATWKLVESGSFDAGALNAAVWDQAIADGEIDTAAVREAFRTDQYYDYHWVLRPDIDDTYGDGFGDRVVDALLTMHEDSGNDAVFELFADDRFVATENANYDALADVARSLGLIEDE
jgi:phosphonate transport system substrate-binding protein